LQNETLADNSSNMTSVPPSGQISDNPDLNIYLMVYGLGAVAVVITLCIRGVLFTMVSEASKIGISFGIPLCSVSFYYLMFHSVPLCSVIFISVPLLFLFCSV